MYDHDKRGFYRVLGSTPNSTSAELKRNYRRLALEHHPDREPDPEQRLIQHDRMRSLNEAYETLRNSELRSRYNEICGFPRCRRHPELYLSGRCIRCREAICPKCSNESRQTLLCHPCAERAERRRSVQDPVERALLALEDGEVDFAYQQLREALLVNPRDVVALTALSTVREKQGDFEGAIAALRLALEIKPGHAFSYYRLGTLHQRIDQESQARSAFEEALRLSPGAPKYAGALASLQSRKDRIHEPRFRPNDRVKHEVFGSGVVTEVTPVGVRVTFGDGGSRWLDPGRAPMVRHAC